MFLLSPHSIEIYVAIWAVAITWHFLRTSDFRISHFDFSIVNYHVMMSPFVLAAVAASFDMSSWTPLWYFGGFAVAGVIGETLVSTWWRLYFANRFWVYQVKTIDHSYTSWLNFIPWAVGGMIYLNTLDQFIANPFDPAYASLWSISLGAAIVFFLLQRALFVLVRPQKRYRLATLASVILFFWPIFALVVLLAYLFGSHLYVLACAFGVIATTAEYLFGKSTEFFVSKRLWTYNYIASDSGHFSPLSIPLFMLGGFYFWCVAQVLHLLIG